MEDREWIPGAPEAIARLNHLDYLIVVVTNQTGIAGGFYSEQHVHILHDYASTELEKCDSKIDVYYYCSHYPDFDSTCSCRKPAPGFILQGAMDLNIDIPRSWIIGDALVDVQPGEAVNFRSVLVRIGYGVGDGNDKLRRTIVVESIVQAVEVITLNRPSFRQ